MADVTTTTEWKSAFALDPPHTMGADYQTIAKADGTYYWVVTTQQPKKLAVNLFGGTNGLGTTYCYELNNSSWVEVSDSESPFSRVIDGLNYTVFPRSSIVAQTWESSELSSSYYPRENFDSHLVPAPVGNAFDAIYTVDALGGILAVLPVVLVAVIGYLAIRKGLGFVHNILQRG